jgi:N-acetylglucosaminyl-diphospho-decaprenol L-rhamnosyltransferase
VTLCAHAMLLWGCLQRPETPPMGKQTIGDRPVVDVVVVNYNAGRFLDACLTSIENCVDGNGKNAVSRILVVDNASNDASQTIVAKHSSVEWLQTGANLGFGRAANRGVAATNAPYVLILNPDTQLDPNAIGEMAAVVNTNEKVGVVGPQVLNADGSRYPSARSFPNLIDAAGHAFIGLITPNNPWSRRYLNPGKVDWVSGTAMLLRRTAFDAVGGFDESYFMYVEDVDLCWRMRKREWFVAVAEKALVTHHIGGSSEQRPLRMIVAHHRSLLRFEARTAIGPRRLMLPVVALGLALRTLASATSRSLRGTAPASSHQFR